MGGARKVMAALVGDGVGSEGTREYETCEDMVNAWENGDADSWTSIASSFLVKNLDREVAGLAMKLTPGMPPVSNLAGQQPPHQESSASSSSTSAPVSNNPFDDPFNLM